jgi:hypothetical protein
VASFPLGLKARKPLKSRNAQNTRHSEIAFNSNVTGTRKSYSGVASAFLLYSSATRTFRSIPRRALT